VFLAYLGGLVLVEVSAGQLISAFETQTLVDICTGVYFANKPPNWTSTCVNATRACMDSWAAVSCDTNGHITSLIFDAQAYAVYSTLPQTISNLGYLSVLCEMVVLPMFPRCGRQASQTEFCQVSSSRNRESGALEESCEEKQDQILFRNQEIWKHGRAEGAA